MKDALEAYKQSPDVLYAEPNYIVHELSMANDPDFPQLWGLQNTGQLGGTPGADIHATEAWNVTTGSSNIVVAVIDTGMDYTHQDLAPNAWTSTASFSEAVGGTTVNCTSGSHGLNVVDSSCDPMDDNGHGTHVSGTIGAVGNNGVGVTGTNWSIQIMSCKFLDASGSGSVDGAVNCLDFVKAMKDQGVHVVATNNSWGGSGFSQALSDAIQAQQQDGILFIAAAGNDSADDDLEAFYPAGYFLPNVVSVAATTRFDWLADFSDFGLHTVSLGAPGQEILSTLPQNSYGILSGTSMAAPHVTGVAALLAAQDPSRDWRAIKNLLLSGGDAIPALNQTISGKRLNAYGSMTCSNSTVMRRLQPALDTVVGSAGTPLILSAININCAQPAGPVTVSVTPGNQTIDLVDNGSAPDQAAQDGIYTGQWTPPGLGDYELTFSTGDTVQVTVLNNYTVGETPYSYQTITGTNLNLGDNNVATVNLPFSIQYGGAGFSTAYVSSNGTISFTNAFDDFLNFAIPVDAIQVMNPQNPPPPVPLQPIVTLVAPYWMDLYPIKGTNQNVFWDVTGSAPNRQLVVEWRNVPSFVCRDDSNANVTFEAVFSENTSNVLFNYANTTFGGECANQNNALDSTIGVQVTQGLGAEWSIDEPSISGGMALLWTPVNPNAPPNPVPAITSALPSTIPAGTGDTWVTLTGTGFISSSQAIGHLTKYQSSTQLQVLLSAGELLYPQFGRGLQINVVNPAPGGGTSPAIYITVTAQAPVITSISPTSVPAGSFGFDLVVNGSGFILGGANVIFNGNEGQTTFVSPNQVIFAVTGAMVQTAGTINVQVQAGPALAGFSNAVPFTITPANSPATIELQSNASSSTSGALSPPRPIVNALPGRFPGWKVANQIGQNYTAKFMRPLARLAPPALATSAVTSLKSVSALSGSGTPPLSLAPAGFNFRPTLPAGFIPTAVVSGDFNKDGKLDWAVANGGDNTIWVYLGNGDGTANLPTIIHLQGLAPVALATADMNGDGKLDLIVAEADSIAVAVLLGNGDGTFGPELTFTTPSIPESLVVADFNRDGKLDVVVGLVGTADTGQLAFLAGDGSGKLGTPITHYGQIDDAAFTTFAIATADFNGDGIPDVVVLDYSLGLDGALPSSQLPNAGARVYLGQGDGTFKLSQQFFGDATDQQVTEGLGDDATAVALGDVNGDGCIDAVTLDSEGTATFFPGLCDGTFDTANIRVFGSGVVAGSAALADLNGDGKLDLVSTAIPFANDPEYQSTPSTDISVQFGDGTGNFGPPTIYRGDPAMVSVAVTDLAKNGHPDIITVNQNSDSISVYANDGHGGFGGPKGGYVGYLENGQMHAVGNPAVSDFAVKDLNGDGLPDLATIEVGPEFPFPTAMTVMLNNGSGGFGPPIRTPIADDNGRLNFFFPDFFFGDFRNSGQQDLMFLNCQSPSTGLGLCYNFAKSNGDGTFEGPVSTPLAPSNIIFDPGSSVTGDFNGDGKLDSLVYGRVPDPAGGNDAGIFPYFGNGDGTFTQGPQTVFSSNSIRSPDITEAVVADVNGDGKDDLLVLGDQLLSSSDDRALYVLLGNGDGTFQPPKLLFNLFGPFIVADLNKDGRPDIVVALNQGTNPAILGYLWGYEVLLGNGDGTFTPGQTYGPYPNPYSFGYLFPPTNHPLAPPQPVIADFNADGIPDMIVYTISATNVFGEIGFAGGTLNASSYILLGNGDGTFSVPSVSNSYGDVLVPQTSADFNADHHADLLELDAYTSAFTILSETNGPTFSVGLVSDPVISSTGTLRIILANASQTGTTLQLSGSDSHIQIPASVTIQSGSISQNVPFQIAAGFNSNNVFALTAQLGSETHIAYGTQGSAQQVGYRAAIENTSNTSVVAGQSINYSMLISSIDGYSTQISISCRGLPSGASCQPGANPNPLPPGGTISVPLTVATSSSLAPNTYPFTVNLTDGVASLALSESFSIGDFALSLTPTTQTLGSNDFTSFTLNVQSIDGYSQAIQVTCSGLPATISCPLSGSVSTGSTYFQVHTQNASAGTYTLSVTGTSSGLIRTASAQLTVAADTFTGSVSQTSVTIAVGNSQNLTVQVNSSGAFQGQVNLACTASSGLTCQLMPAQVILSTGGSTTSMLNIAVNEKPAFVPSNVWRSLGRPSGGPWLTCLWAAFLILLALLIRAVSRWPSSGIGSDRAWSCRLVLGFLILIALGISSCGGGGGGGAGGGGGGGPTFATVNVQGTAGGTTVSLASVSVTVP